MKILVAVKRVIDPYVKIRIQPDAQGVETQHVKMTMNPFDEIALEEALRLREKNIAGEVIAVSIGNTSVQETLRHALALGADRAIHVQTETTHCSLNIAKILAKIVAEENPGLVLMGKQSIDGDNNQTPQMLSVLLGWPQAVFASNITLSDHGATVTREIDGGLETLAVSLPAVISVDLRLNAPRYASLPNIMKAKSRPLQLLSLDALHLTLVPHIVVESVQAPVAKSAGTMVDSVETLLDKLQHEASVL